jgi:hypothetical protein
MSSSEELVREATIGLRSSLADVLDEIEATIMRYIIFPSEHEPVALALWVPHTHALEAAWFSPYVHLTSPDRESAKSRSLEVLEPLVPDGHRMVLPTAAIIYGLLDAADGGRPPVFFIDEVDNWLTGRAARTEIGQALLGVLNDGYHRGGSVPRTEWHGKQRVVHKLPTFGAKVLAGIAALPDPIASRTIPIRLQRKKRSETVAPFRERTSRPELERLRDRIAAVIDRPMLDRLANATPDLPGALSDRQKDLWEPLAALADEAGGDWPHRARAAAVALHARGSVSDEATGTALLRDAARIFAEGDVDRLFTADLARGLTELEDASGPWAEWWRRDLADGGVKSVGHRIAKLLRPFNIEPSKIRIGDRTAQGYLVTAFVDPLERYVAPTPPFDGTTEQNRQNTPDDLHGSDVPLLGGMGPQGVPR